MAIDLFGRQAAKRAEELSNQMVAQAKEIKKEATRQVATIRLDRIKAMQNQRALGNFYNNFNTQIFPHYNVVKEQLIYQTLDDIYSVVSRLAEACAMIPFYGEYKDGSELKETDKLNLFLATLTYEERIKIYTYLLLQGEVFAYKEKVDFGVNAGVQKLRILNPYNMVVNVTQTFPLEIAGYTYYDTVNGYSVYIDAEDMMFIALFNPDMDTQKAIRGLAPIAVLKQRITRIKAGLDVSVAQMQNGGVPGVLYEKTLGIEKGAIGQRQEMFARYLNNSANKGAPFFTQGDLGYEQIGSTLADMSLAELASIDLDKICNVYHISSTELNNKQASTESNVTQHRKSFYTAGVLPKVTLVRDGLNYQVLPDIKTTAILKEDISDVTELQDDMKTKAEGYAASPIMVPNEVREGLGQKRIEDDPNMDKVYVKTGYTLLEDVATTVENIPNTAGDYVDPNNDNGKTD